MNRLENLLQQYLVSFFNNDAEKYLFNMECDNIKYINSKVSDWLEVENQFKKLLHCDGLNNYFLEIADTGSFFIKKLFNKYVDNNTFVVESEEHSIIKENIDNSQNVLKLTYDIVKKFDIDSIIQKYKQSGCSKIFIYATGVLETHVTPQAFYIKLKEALVENNIEHILILDDVQTMFMIPKDYSIYDDVIFTCHALVPAFNSGILFSKKFENLGYTDADKLSQYLNSLEIVLDKKDKLYLFNTMLQQYYGKELVNKDIFTIPENSPLHNFYILLTNPRYEKLLNKYADELKEYNIEISGMSIVIRSTAVLKQEPVHMIEGFKKLKEVLQKLIELKDRV